MFELLEQRRSVRKFKSQPIEVEKIDKLKEALLRAPSSRNFQPCEFIFVDDPKLLAALATAKKHGSAFLAASKLAVVIAANPEVSDVWVEDSAIAAIILQLAAEQLELKSCWAQLHLRPHTDNQRASDYVRNLMGLPVGMEVAMVIGIGYPAENIPGHPRESLQNKKIHHNHFS